MMAVPRQRINLPPGAWRSAVAGLARGDFWDGPDIERFERAFAESIGVLEAVTVPSGRAGFRFLFEALALEPGSEVICSAFGYPVVPFLIKKLGFDVKFVDCEMRTLGMDPAALASSISPRTRAVVATHLYGVPCRIDEISQIARAHDAILIEDCAHCFGASVGDQKAGAFGDAGCFSFETSKVINTMGGGIITLKDSTLAARLRETRSREPRNSMRWLSRRLLKTTFEAAVTNPVLFNLGVYQALRLASQGAEKGRFASGYHGDEISMSGKMGRYTNYQAQLGLKQLPAASDRDARRRANAERLIGRLRDVVRFQEPAGPEVAPNYMLVTALVPRLEELALRLLRSGVDTKHLYMRDCSALFDNGARCENAARAEREALHLPAHAELSTSQIDAIAAKTAYAIKGLSGEGAAHPSENQSPSTT